MPSCDIAPGANRAGHESAIGAAEYFWADLLRQVDWYRDHANGDVAERYVDAVQSTLLKLAKIPSLGRPRFKNHPALAGMYSLRVEKPYQRI